MATTFTARVAHGLNDRDRIRLTRYVESAGYLDLLQRAMAAAEAVQPVPCNEIIGRKRQSLTPIEPIVFKGDVPTHGVWWDRLEAKRCGSPAVYNILVSHSRTEGPKAVPLLMGTTEADPVLLRDTVWLATETASQVFWDPGCPALVVESTAFYEGDRISHPTAHPDRNMIWRELWTVYGCGPRVLVEMRFESTTAGMKVEARLAAPNE